MKFFALLFGAALLAVPSVLAQYGGPKQQPPQPPAQAGQPAAKPGETPAPATPPVNKEEEDAAKALFDMKTADTAQSIPAGENFLQKFPDSRYRDSVYAKLVHDYLNAGQEDKVVATGIKALQANPDNVDVLAFMSWFLGHRHHPNALDAEQQLQAVEKYGRRGLELIATLQKPENVTDDSFQRAKNEKLGLCHSGLALFNYWQNRTPEMVAEFTQSTAIDPTPDPIDFYLLGDGDAKLKKYADAVTAYDHCSLVSWAWQERCKTKLAQAKTLAAAQPAPAPAAPTAAPAAPAPAADTAKPKPPKS
jgi:tetratricopeptide (TPR) repeat protein